MLQTVEGDDDLKKGTQLLEIYALEIQMYTAQKNNKKLKVCPRRMSTAIHKPSRLQLIVILDSKPNPSENGVCSFGVSSK